MLRYIKKSILPNRPKGSIFNLKGTLDLPLSGKASVIREKNLIHLCQGQVTGPTPLISSHQVENHRG